MPINRKSISLASTELNNRQVFTEHCFEEASECYPVKAPSLLLSVRQWDIGDGSSGPQKVELERRLPHFQTSVNVSRSSILLTLECSRVKQEQLMVPLFLSSACFGVNAHNTVVTLTSMLGTVVFNVSSSDQQHSILSNALKMQILVSIQELLNQRLGHGPSDQCFNSRSLDSDVHSHLRTTGWRARAISQSPGVETTLTSSSASYSTFPMPQFPHAKRG